MGGNILTESDIENRCVLVFIQVFYIGMPIKQGECIFVFLMEIKSSQPQ